MKNKNMLNREKHLGRWHNKIGTNLLTRFSPQKSANFWTSFRCKNCSLFPKSPTKQSYNFATK
ncbi:hypothetical protein T11_4447 [Trichinella zimbabwensis]|uniref:Uncharacterized protein n=1 Tax=Trichinella zimbabwensis TaxID=268475 RepID=A0A0V1I552_9BILA|nr:hypothetical protein T11_4447 [Trichinella zimbabwensis]